MSTQVTKIPKGFWHLKSTTKNKFQLRYAPRAPQPPKAWVKPKDRIGRWNIVPGDKVRLMVGKPKERYNNEVEGAKSGYKVYTVHSVDMVRNRVFLNGLTNKKSNTIRPIPENIDELPEDERGQWLDQKNYVDTRRAVQYSNVQLCIEDKGPASVFATRIATSAPVLDKNARRWRWDRFAAQTSKDSDLPYNEDREQIPIPWPKVETPKPTEATACDTVAEHVTQRTLQLGTSKDIPAPLVPKSMRAPVAKDQTFSNSYIFKSDDRNNALLEAAMPLYLGEELAPRFGRFKMAKAWKARNEMVDTARKQFIEQRLASWEAGGRDGGILELLSLETVGLDGVNMRPRTRKEIREETGAEFDDGLAEHKAAYSRALFEGKQFDTATGEFVDGPKSIKIAAKRARKEHRAAKKLEKLRTLTLSDEKNQVVPEDVRAA